CGLAGAVVADERGAAVGEDGVEAVEDPRAFGPEEAELLDVDIGGHETSLRSMRNGIEMRDIAPRRWDTEKSPETGTLLIEDTPVTCAET
ncbi:hypothetical protein ADL26_16680, partial [Thermoactinomyces vulgaris]